MLYNIIINKGFEIFSDNLSLNFSIYLSYFLMIPCL